MTRQEMKALAWDAVDVLLITGDAYVDHPAFGAALLGRHLMAAGYRVGIVAQPRWDTPADVLRLGRPRLFAGVTAGALDSMLAHYTAFRKLRHDDAYTPGDKHGARPNRAAIVYTGLLRQAFPGLPVIIGGVEASLRRASHYDFWSDKIRRSILLDSKADLLVYGMGERAVLEIAQRLEDAVEGKPAEMLRGIPGTAFAISSLEALQAQGLLDECVVLPSHEDVLADPKALMSATLALELQTHQGTHWATQASGSRWVAFAPPAAPLSQSELDALYRLPFSRRPHPSYTLPIPAAAMIQFSITAHRGCAAGCTFCSITLHQGRQIQSRSEASVLEEVKALTRHPDWKGSISDVGGPTANMWGGKCKGDPAVCRRRDCLFPKQCPHFVVDEVKMSLLLTTIAALEGVNHVRVASGVRYDMGNKERLYLRTVVRGFVGGQLKVAPEHISNPVLRLMRKPTREAFERFLDLFEDESRRAGKEQYVAPYLISAFPGCTDRDMRELAQWLKRRGWRPRQVQCFIPTPGTVATAMYHAGIDEHGKPIHVARSDRDRLRQHRLLLPTRNG
ncbi:MAG TPA: YgiQ family radical SAM protein [Candidatus Hydrogenedentes bacterium]|nr:YgiQ family radical SAM protein [Candidatus Hydrogenedentota bacterium]